MLLLKYYFLIFIKKVFTNLSKLMKNILFILVAIVFISCSQNEMIKPVNKVSGKITLGDSGVAKKEIYLYRQSFTYNQDNLVKAYPVSESGEFEIEIPEGINFGSLHLCAEGYYSAITNYITGDENPRIEAVLFRKAIPMVTDSIEILYLYGNNVEVKTMERIDSTKFSISFENTFKQDSLLIQTVFSKNGSQAVDGLKTSMVYDNNGDYYNVLRPNKKDMYSIEIDLDNFRKVANIAKAPQSKSKWIDGESNISFNAVLDSLGDKYDQIDMDYTIFVKREADQFIEGWDEESIANRAERVKKTINDGLVYLTNEIEKAKSLYLRDYLISQKFSVLNAIDSLTYEEMISQLDTISEIPTKFYDVYDSFLSYPNLDTTIKHDDYIAKLSRKYNEIKDDYNRNYLRYSLISTLNYSPYFMEQEKYLNMMIDSTNAILTENVLPEWIKDAAVKFLKKVELEKTNIAPNFAFKSFDGVEMSLNDLRGKWVLLDFWGTWCQPCVMETPHLKAAYEEFAGNNFEILSLARDSGPDVVKNYISAKEIKWINTMEYEGYAEGVLELYGVNSYPTIYLLNPNGEIDRSVNEGELRGEQLKVTLAKKLISK